MLHIEQLKQRIEETRASFLADIRVIKHDERALTTIRNKYLARKGILPNIYAELVQLPLEHRKEVGLLLNEVKAQMENLVRHRELRAPKEESVAYPDISMPASGVSMGSLHPITLTLMNIESFFTTQGFACCDHTKELTTLYYNFDSLNILESHPSRSLSDTFYVGHNHVLRTHTSSAQQSILANCKQPARYLIPGNVYRRDSDMTHTPMFTQVEGLLVEPGLTYQYLLQLLRSFILHFFGSKIEMRVRSSYFPFTSPSAEIDIKQNGTWVEVLGCGVIHPKVLAHCQDLPAGYSGLAFGMGVERLTCLKYGLKNLRTLYLNDLRFLQQFSPLSKHEI
jgi:phenylalanyl-tRNA synthetase alpha chain